MQIINNDSVLIDSNNKELMIDAHSRILTQEEWEHVIKPALESCVKAFEIVQGKKQIKPDNTGETNFNENSKAKSPVKEVG